MKKYIACFFMLLCLLLTTATPALAAGFSLPEDIQLTAGSVYMVNLDTDIVVYEQDAYSPRSVASLTKLMTALLLLENVPDLAGTMITAENALYVPPITNSNSSHADIRPGEEVSALNMLYAMMLPSANEAAEAVGYYLGNGNLNNFYALMNARAAELGCTNTSFCSTNGLLEMDVGNYSSAYDLYLIANACWQHEVFRTVVSSVEHEMPVSNKHSAAYSIRSTNAMLKPASGELYRSYIKGIKTGSTEAAGRNFLSAAVNSNGESFLCVVLGCPYEPTESGFAQSFYDTAALYDWMFGNFSVRPSLNTSTPITEIRVNYSTDLDTLRLYPASDLKTILPNGDDSALEHTFHLPESLDAPIAQGDVVGSVTLTLSGEVIGTVDLLAEKDVTRNPVLYVFAQIKTFLGSLYFKVVVILLLLFLLAYGGLTLFVHQQSQQKGRKPTSKRRMPPPSAPPPSEPPERPISSDPEDGPFFRFDDDYPPSD